MKKIEVLHFGISSNPGGIETWAKKLWDHINKERFHFSFIDMTGEGNSVCFRQEYMNSGVDLYKITPRNVSWKKNREDLENLFSQHQFDIFHFSVNTLSYIAPVEIALKYGCKVIVHSHSSGVSHKVHTRLFHQLNKRKLQSMPVQRIAVSPVAGKWLFGNSDFSVFYNGVDTTKFVFSQKSRERIRKELQSEDKLVIANVGAFLPVKNHSFMVDVFEEVQKIEKSSVLWFVGGGAGRQAIEAKVKEKGLSDSVRFCGIRQDMPDLYAGMDLFLFPSLYEGFPIAVLEAECEGVPCILSDTITKEVIVGENTIALSLSRGMSEWARKTVEMAKIQKKNREMCGKEVVEAGFSVEAETNRMKKLYESVIR